MATPTAPLLRLALLGIGLVLVLLPGLLLMRELLHVGMQEDAMIGLRHLRNMLEGSGFVYNRGESALGTTNPLFWVFSFLAIKPFYLASPSVDVLVAHYYFCGLHYWRRLSPLHWPRPRGLALCRLLPWRS